MRIATSEPDWIDRYVAFARDAQARLRARGLRQWVPAAHDAHRPQVDLLVAAGELFAVLDGTEPIAFFALRDASGWWPPLERPVRYVSGIVVSRAARGRGVGGTIVEWCIERARSSGAVALRLDCHDGNAWLCEYYERFGFVARDRVEQHPGYVGRLYELPLR